MQEIWDKTFLLFFNENERETILIQTASSHQPNPPDLMIATSNGNFKIDPFFCNTVVTVFVKVSVSNVN